MMIKRFCLAVACVVVMSSPAFAQQPPPADKVNYLVGKEPDATKIPVLKSVLDFGAQPVWIGTWGGLNGWVANKASDTAVFYTTADGKGIISGMMFDETGQNITLKQIEGAETAGRDMGALSAAHRTARAAPVPAPAAAPTSPAPSAINAVNAATPAPVAAPAPSSAPTVSPGVSPGETLYQALTKTNRFTVGMANTPPLYVFFDPNCPHCKRLYEELTSGPVKSGRLHMEMIPVGLLSENSMKYASALLASTTPVQSFEAFLAGAKTNLSEQATEQSLEKAIQNTKLFLDWKFDGVPVSVYKDKQGKVKIIKARPQDLNVLVNDIGS